MSQREKHTQFKYLVMKELANYPEGKDSGWLSRLEQFKEKGNIVAPMLSKAYFSGLLDREGNHAKYIYKVNKAGFAMLKKFEDDLNRSPDEQVNITVMSPMRRDFIKCLIDNGPLTARQIVDMLGDESMSRIPMMAFRMRHDGLISYDPDKEGVKVYELTEYGRTAYMEFAKDNGIPTSKTPPKVTFQSIIADIMYVVEKNIGRGCMA